MASIRRLSKLKKKKSYKQLDPFPFQQKQNKKKFRRHEESRKNISGISLQINFRIPFNLP